MRILKFRNIIGISALVLCLNAVADQQLTDSIEVKRLRQNLQNCLNKAGSGLMERSLCYFNSEASAEAELNRKYRSVVQLLRKRIASDPDSATYDKETLKRLHASEVVWIQYREAQALLEAADSFGGDEAEAMVNRSRIHLTLERINFLGGIK